MLPYTLKKVIYIKEYTHTNKIYEVICPVQPALPQEWPTEKRIKVEKRIKEFVQQLIGKENKGKKLVAPQFKQENGSALKIKKMNREIERKNNKIIRSYQELNPNANVNLE